MPVYRIAGINVMMNPQGNLLKERSEKYLVNGGADTADMCIDENDKAFANWLERFKNSSFELNEYSWYGYEFYKRLVDFGGLFLHGSAIAAEGQAYIFSGNKGAGKSTHTSLWLKYFKEKNLGVHPVVINDDKPALLFKDDKVFACGTPFSGKTDKNANIKAPLCGVCFISKGEKNKINEITKQQALKLAMGQTLFFKDKVYIEKYLFLLKKLIENVIFYQMKADISFEAVKVSYSKMKG